MSKGISEDLTIEIRRVLEERVNGGPDISVDPAFGRLTPDAIDYLEDIGALYNQGSTYRITAFGRQYWERISTPVPIYWFKNNWFAAIVAAATVAASVSGAVANLR